MINYCAISSWHFVFWNYISLDSPLVARIVYKQSNREKKIWSNRESEMNIIVCVFFTLIFFCVFSIFFFGQFIGFVLISSPMHCYIGRWCWILLMRDKIQRYHMTRCLSHTHNLIYRRHNHFVDQSKCKRAYPDDGICKNKQSNNNMIGHSYNASVKLIEIYTSRWIWLYVFIFSWLIWFRFIYSGFFFSSSSSFKINHSSNRTEKNVFFIVFINHIHDIS